MKLSTGVLTHVLSLVAGTAGFRSGWKAQNFFSASVNSREFLGRGAASVVRTAPGQDAPACTQVRRSASSSSFSLPLGGIFSDSS